MEPSEVTKWREDRDLTKAALADLLGVHWMTVSRWELGGRAIPPFLHLALAYLNAAGTKPTAKKPKASLKTLPSRRKRA